MKKALLLSALFCLTKTLMYAQSVDDGIRLLYYEKNKSALQTLQQAMAAKPKDAYTIYWTGQAMIKNNDVAGAKTLYQNALNGGVNDPWIWVGSGHVQLLENNDINSAKQKFEQAITSSKDKKGRDNAAILDAIGRANADGSSKQGDPVYAIDILKRAQQIDTKNPDIDVNLAICYLKEGSDKGGEAVTALMDAISRDPKYARAYTLIGTIYKSQDNKQSMTEWYDKAIAADPTYAPAYLSYFLYYSERDVNQAKEYLDKYVANADKDCNTDYFVADYLFRAGKYQESLAKAKEMESSGGCKDFSRINILYAYNYDRLGDSMQSKNYIQRFFAMPAVNREPTDYVIAAKIYSKFAGNEDTAGAYLQRAIDADTIKANKLAYVDSAINMFSKTGRIQQQLVWLGKRNSFSGGGALKESDYYKLGTAAANAIPLADSLGRIANDATQGTKAYMLADSIAKAYIAAYPDKPQGYSLRVLAAKKADRDTTKGLAIDAINQQTQFLLKDTAAINKKIIFGSEYYLLLYYTQYAKDAPKAEEYKKAIDVLDQMLQLYPTAGEEHDFAQKTKDALQASLKKYEQQKNQPPPKTKPTKEKS